MTFQEPSGLLKSGSELLGFPDYMCKHSAERHSRHGEKEGEMGGGGGERNGGTERERERFARVASSELNETYSLINKGKGRMDG